jgi:hypothetical protein
VRGPILKKLNAFVLENVVREKTKALGVEVPNLSMELHGQSIIGLLREQRHISAPAYQLAGYQSNSVSGKQTKVFLVSLVSLVLNKQEKPDKLDKPENQGIRISGYQEMR